MGLSDDDPLWDTAWAGRGDEWGEGDEDRAEDYYSRSSGSTKLILDLWMDRPGERVDTDWIVDHLSRSASGRSPVRLSVSAALTAMGKRQVVSKRRRPY
jgi:hypothetical protein